MGILKKVLLPGFLFFSMCSFGQFKFKNGKRLGIVLGVHSADIKNKHVDFTSEIGFNIGLMLSPNYERKWNMVYGLEYFKSNVSSPIRTGGIGLSLSNVTYALSGVQAKALVSYSLFKTNVSVELGPVLQFNNELKGALHSSSGGFYGADPPLNWDQFEKVNRTNINGYFGVSAGIKRIRAIVFCQYGINNIFNKVEDRPGHIPRGPYEGHFTMIGGQVVFNLN